MLVLKDRLGTVRVQTTPDQPLAANAIPQGTTTSVGSEPNTALGPIYGYRASIRYMRVHSVDDSSSSLGIRSTRAGKSFLYPSRIALRIPSTRKSKKVAELILRDW